MLRRFETYRFDPHAPEAARARLRSAFRDASRYLPEVLHSATGANVTDVPVQLVWEHAYRSAADYRRYMEHPFHASVLDRYLLADSPERVVVDSDLGVGLAGYTCDRPDFYLSSGVRRLVLLDMRMASPGEIDAMSVVAEEAKDPDVSVFAANTLASAWFDGETPLGAGPRWSHLWEQGFTDHDALGRDGEGGDTVAGPVGRRWEEVPGVAAALTISYRIEPGWGYDSVP